ncbi:DUF1178 family protein [Paucibacter soli]|uniref:DUF1178 family protein n=1 Tax=Paucibacter soli TaxID=3133433 RepID=UPI0030B10CE8
MLVLNLACEHGHSFEAWFGSAADYESQQQRQLVSCPICGSQDISRMPSAPRLNVSHLRAEPAALKTAQALAAVRQLIANTEDVGERFAEEARRIHYGEAEERGIRGRASAEQTRELVEEGIAVLPLPMADALKGTLQ